MLPSVGLRMGGFLTCVGVACSSLPDAPWLLWFSGISHIVFQQMEIRRKDKGHSLTFHEVTLWKSWQKFWKINMHSFCFHKSDNVLCNRGIFLKEDGRPWQIDNIVKWSATYINSSFFMKSIKYWQQNFDFSYADVDADTCKKKSNKILITVLCSQELRLYHCLNGE